MCQSQTGWSVAFVCRHMGKRRLRPWSVDMCSTRSVPHCLTCPYGGRLPKPFFGTHSPMTWTLELQETSAEIRKADWRQNSLPRCTRGRRPHDVIHLWSVAPGSEIRFAQILTQFVNSWAQTCLSTISALQTWKINVRSTPGMVPHVFLSSVVTLDIQTLPWDYIFGPNLTQTIKTNT